MENTNQLPDKTNEEWDETRLKIMELLKGLDITSITSMFMRMESDIKSKSKFI